MAADSPQDRRDLRATPASQDLRQARHRHRADRARPPCLSRQKFATFLRNELCSNNLRDFGLKKSLENLDVVREKFQTITSRFASYQAQWLNVHGDFPL